MEKTLIIRFKDNEEQVKFQNHDCKILKKKLEELLNKQYCVDIIEIEIPEDRCSA